MKKTNPPSTYINNRIKPVRNISNRLKNSLSFFKTMFRGTYLKEDESIALTLKIFRITL